MCVYMHKHVIKLPKHPLTLKLDTLLLKEEGQESTRVPDDGQAAEQGVGSAWAQQDKLVTGPVWDRKKSDNHDFFCLVVQ